MCLIGYLSFNFTLVGAWLIHSDNCVSVYIYFENKLVNLIYIYNRLDHF